MAYKNYKVCNDHRRTECDYRQKPNTQTFFKTYNIPPDTTPKPEKEDMSRKTQMYVNPTLDTVQHRKYQTTIYLLLCISVKIGLSHPGKEHMLKNIYTQI